VRRRLGIAIVVQNIDSTGGMERQALQLAERWVRRGARVWILSTIHVTGMLPRFPGGLRPKERRGRLTIYRVPMSSSWMWEWCLSLYELVIAWVLLPRATALDAIYAVYWTSAVQAAPAAHVLGCPMFVKFAGGGEIGDLATIERSPERRRALTALAGAEKLVCVSPQIADEARRAGFGEERLLAIPNGVDLRRFEDVRPAPLPGPEGSEHVLVVAGLRREKRLPELVRSFASVARARPRSRLVIAGEGVEEPAIRAAAREEGLAERVHLLGRRSDVPALLAASRVFVISSVSEGLSNSLLEALASGVPVVATDIEGNRAVLEHEKDALLVPLGDQDALARAVVRLLGDRELAARLARAAREKARAYGLDEVATRYEAAFHAASRPLPTSLGLVWRYALHFESAGLTGLARRLSPVGYYEVRDAVTWTVVRLKRFLGIEGDIMTRLRPKRTG
jgi:glycosyltransferase involved in cell wall biosynthesis